MLEALNRFFATLGGWCFDHRLVAGGLCLAVVAAAVGLAGTARIDNSYEAFFALDDPVYLAYQRYRDDFGSDEVSYILYEAPGTRYGAFDLDVMRRIADLTEALEEEVPFIYEVRSLTNAELMVGLDDGIEIINIRKLRSLNRQGKGKKNSAGGAKQGRHKWKLLSSRIG